jgi:hypothetical protein
MHLQQLSTLLGQQPRYPTSLRALAARLRDPGTAVNGFDSAVILASPPAAVGVTELEGDLKPVDLRADLN